MTMKDDDIIRLIENFKFDAGPVAVERRNRGFTLIHAETGVPIARLRPIGRDDLVEILYWSLWKERWATFKFPSLLRLAPRMAEFNSPPKMKMEAII